MRQQSIGWKCSKEGEIGDSIGWKDDMSVFCDLQVVVFCINTCFNTSVVYLYFKCTFGSCGICRLIEKSKTLNRDYSASLLEQLNHTVFTTCVELAKKSVLSLS